MGKVNKYWLTSVLLLLLMSMSGWLNAQTDSLIVNVGKSKIVFIVNDPKDLESMQQYDLNKILDQLSLKLTGDSSLVRDNGLPLEDTTVVVNDNPEVVEVVSDYNSEGSSSSIKRRKRKRTFHNFNIDLGTNNYVTDGKFPDETNELYAVKPWGSWYVGLNSTYRTRIVGPFSVEWGGGVSWYNFKFEDPSVTITDTDNGVVFSNLAIPDATFEKSKLTVAYVQASVVPMLSFGDRYGRDNKMWRDWFGNDHYGQGFRIGFGGYVGYRIDSYSKMVVETDDRKKNRDHDNFHLENFRYGARFQVGYKGTDLFFNYDLNELFIPDKGPKLNAFSFGIIL